VVAILTLTSREEAIRIVIVLAAVERGNLRRQTESDHYRHGDEQTLNKVSHFFPPTW
jgi:hypothetical protein